MLIPAHSHSVSTLDQKLLSQLVRIIAIVKDRNTHLGDTKFGRAADFAAILKFFQKRRLKAGNVLGKMGKSPENSKNSVCFREQRAVHNREAKTHSESLESAGHHGGLGQKQKGIEEADQNPGEENVA